MKGTEYSSHKFQIENKVFKISIWDTAGQERYRAINKTFYRGAKGGFLVIDLTTVPDVKDLKHWLDEFQLHAEEGAIVFLVGNKVDLPYGNETLKLIDDFSKENGLPFTKVSAKTGENVTKVMENMVNLINDQFYKNPVMDSIYESVSDVGRITKMPGKSIILPPSHQLRGNTSHNKECCMT